MFTGSIGSRATFANTDRSVALSTFSSRSEASGWPTLIATTPPGASRERASSKNSLVVR